MKKEIILFILIGILTTSGLASASWMSYLRASKDFVTSSGTMRVSAQGGLSEAAAGDLAMSALSGGSTKAFWRIALKGTGTIGMIFLAYDIYKMVSTLNAIPGIKTGGPNKLSCPQTIYLPGGKSIALTRAFRQVCARDCYNTITITLTGTNQYPQMLAQSSGNVPYANNKYEIGVYVTPSWGGGTTLQYFRDDVGFDLVIHSYLTPDSSVSGTWPGETLNETAARNWVASNQYRFTDPDTSEIQVTQQPPDAGDMDLGDATSTATIGYQNNEDPDTGQDMSDVITYYDSGGVTQSDTVSVPGQPVGDETGTSITSYIPEEKNIGSLLSSWMANAPFAEMYNNFEIDASGSGVVYIPLPAVFGGTAVLDFEQYSTLWAAIAAIVIAFAYLYAMMIIFIGR